MKLSVVGPSRRAVGIFLSASYGDVWVYTDGMRVADYIAKTLEDLGVDCCFLVAGGMMMHLMDAFGRSKMRYVCHHHEQAAAMAADAYARQTGKLGVCLATSGPGATNLLTGLVGAYQDSIPVLFLTGQAKRKETISGRGIAGLRQGGFLDVDIVSIVKSVTKYAAVVDEPMDICYRLGKAIHRATSGRPGPVLLDLPLDVQAAEVDPEAMPRYAPDDSASLSEPSELPRIIQAVQAAKRPLLLAGHGIRCAGLVDEFRNLVDRWKVPVVTSMMAKDLLPESHPLLVGQIGQRGNRGANLAVQASDVILTMGCSLHLQTIGYEAELFAPQARVIEIDLDRALLERNSLALDWTFLWGLHEYLPVLIRDVAPCSIPEWLGACQDWKQRFQSANEPHVLGELAAPVNLYEFVDLLSDALPRDTTILTDAGQPFYIVPQALRLKAGQRYLVPGSLAGMGWALPASIGVASAAPGRLVIAIVGDGSFQTNIQELQTIAHHRLNVKLFVVNNGGYASIRGTQKRFCGGLLVGSSPETGVSLPNLRRIAAAYEIPYLCCGTRGWIAWNIRQALATDGPVICELMTQSDQQVIPMVPSYMLPDGSMRSKGLDEMLPAVPLDRV